MIKQFGRIIVSLGILFCVVTAHAESIQEFNQKLLDSCEIPVATQYDPAATLMGNVSVNVTTSRILDRATAEANLVKMCSSMGGNYLTGYNEYLRQVPNSSWPTKHFDAMCEFAFSVHNRDTIPACEQARGELAIYQYAILANADATAKLPALFNSCKCIKSIRVEAEKYSQMNNVGVENTNDIGGGENVGWIQPGSWMDYNVKIPSTGTYTLKLRISNKYNGGKLKIMNSQDQDLTPTIILTDTGDYQVFVTDQTTLQLSAGEQTIRIYAIEGGWNINWFELSK